MVYIKGLPSSFEGFRIVHLSDLHGKIFADMELVNKVNDLKPDMIAITGDVFDDSEKIPLEYVDSVFKDFKARNGTYFVVGNNDLYLGELNIKSKLASLGITTLLNENVKLGMEGQYIDVIGVNDPFYQKHQLDMALEGSESSTKILLAHTPEIIDEASEAGIDLVLVGHTHGGQVRIPFLPQLKTNVRKGYEKYHAGLYKIKGTQMYINRGLGVNDIHLRFLARPELTVLVLRRG